MIGGMYEQDFLAYIIFGLFMNVLLSMMFGLYLSKNIGMEEMMSTAGEYKQPWWSAISLFIPFAKMLITLYRIAILQFYFLNQGKSHKDFWVYITHQKNQ
jgi:hypothetical protein